MLTESGRRACLPPYCTSSVSSLSTWTMTSWLNPPWKSCSWMVRYVLWVIDICLLNRWRFRFFSRGTILIVQMFMAIMDMVVEYKNASSFLSLLLEHGELFVLHYVHLLLLCLSLFYIGDLWLMLIASCDRAIVAGTALNTNTQC